MDEAKVIEIFARMRDRLAKNEEPDEADVLALAEGALVNLARLAGR